MTNAKQFYVDGHAVKRSKGGSTYAVADTPEAAKDIASILNSHEALYDACRIFIRRYDSKMIDPVLFGDALDAARAAIQLAEQP